MTELWALTARNTKLFFKDKGMFFTALVTPMILLVLYMTFLFNVYETSFTAALPQGFVLDGKVLGGAVGGQLVSSLLAVCCVTVAFCSNMVMVQDKVNGAGRDIAITPVKGFVVAMAYYLSTAFITLIICFVAMGAGMLYLGYKGWYLSSLDVLGLAADTFLLSMFGTALSSVVSFFLSSQGQISAVGTIVSAGYGFICGAYMPMSNFSQGLREVLSFLPGTYGTVLLRNHAMGGAFAQMEADGVPKEIVDSFRAAVDCELYCMDNYMDKPTMYIVLGASVLALVCAYVVMNVIKLRKGTS